jgi:hypothetical protein
MLKRVIILLIVLITIFGCAKKSTEWKDSHILNLVSAIPTVGNPLDLDAADSLVYVAEDQGGLSIVNLNNFTKKWYTAFTDAQGVSVNLIKIRKVSVVKPINRMFINETDGTDLIRIIDTSNPDSLKVIDAITGATQDIQDMLFRQITEAGSEFSYEGLFCSGRNIKYGKFGVHVPGLPPYYGNTLSVDTPANANGFYLTDQYLFVAAEQRGLFIYNRNDGVLVGQVDLPGEAQKVKVMGNYAYLACRQDGLQVVDVSNPAAPVKVGSFDTTGYATNLDVWSSYVVVSSGGGGVYLFDVSSPLNPVLKDNITDCGYVNAVKYFQNKVLVASRDRGLLIYSILP